MKRIFPLLFLFWSLAIPMKAQELPSKLSLKEAQAIALKNHPDLKLNELNTAIAQKQSEQLKTKKIPEISGNYDLRRNLIIPVTPVPAIAFNPTSKEGDLIPLKFATNWTSNTGLTAKMNLYNPLLKNQLEESQQQVVMSQLETETTRHNLKFLIANDYAAAAIAIKQLSLAENDTLAKTKILEIVQQRYDSGRVKITELNLARQNKNSSVSGFLQAKNIYENALAQLWADMGFNPEQNYPTNLQDDLDNLLNSSIAERDKSLSKDFLTQQQKLNKIQLEGARSEVLPSLSLNGYLGANYFDNNFHIFDGSNWYGNSFLNLSLNIPLTQRYEKSKRMEIIRLQGLVNETQYNIQQSKLNVEKAKTIKNISFRENDLAYKKAQMNLAEASLRVASDQYADGRLFADELTQNDLLFQQSKNAYLQAAYELLLARLNLEKLNEE